MQLNNFQLFMLESKKAEDAEKRRLEKKIEQERELQKKEMERLEKIMLEKTLLIPELNRLRQSDYQNVNTFYNKSCKEYISASEYEQGNVIFVKDWLSKHLPEGKDGKTLLPDDEQVSAIAEVWKNTQVIARAGSGKTSTLVNRAYFLQKHCGVAPNEILLLAFNRKAANEIAERLGKLCGNSAAHVMTFHALANAIVHPKQELIYNDSAEENQGLDSVFGAVINDRLLEDDFMDRVRKLMMAQFKQDWDKLIKGGYGFTPKELYLFQKNLARETLRGGYVKSHGEKVISNFLFEHNIPYIYEYPHYWEGSVYRADFTLPVSSAKGKGIIIEYFGLAKTDPEYDEQMEEKRKYWSKSDKYELIELTPEDFIGGTKAFEATLKKHLINAGIKCNRLTDEEIWQNIKPRVLKRFSSAMSGFVGRCRKSWILPENLEQMITTHKSILDAEDDFLLLAVILYTDYLERLEAEKQQDYDGLMQMAVSKVESGTTIFKRVKKSSGDLIALRYIFIDEYQDFSVLFHRLIEAVRLHNPEIKFFCVGDDWQAINGFAGSDLMFYENFDSYFPQPRQLYISTNYRSVSSVVTVGNALMSGVGKPAVASNKIEGIVRIVNLSKFSPTLIEEEKFKKGILTPIILRLAGKALCENKSVALLSRTKNLFVPSGGYISIEKYLEIIRKLLPEDWRKNITISTAHSFKGREGDVVIVMDAFSGIYPLIHPNWIFSRILGTSIQQIDDEDRRLFYVALTRAKESLFIITENGNLSPYLTDIIRHGKIPDIDWDKYPPVTGDSNVLIVRISGISCESSDDFDALTIEFKADNFQYRKQNGKHFRVKRFLLEGFAIQNLQNTPWAEKTLLIPDSRLDVSVLDSFNNIVESYSVVAGQWTKRVEPIVSLVDTTALVVKSGTPIEKKSQEYLQLQIEEDEVF